MDVEALAVSVVSGAIAACPRLSPNITTADRVPFTDGHIDVYAGGKRRKKDWMGRVSVQVKGRSRAGEVRQEETYRFSRDELIGYQKASGVLFFYVSIDVESSRRTIYYSLLAPHVVQWMLGGMPEGQQSRAVTLAILPEDVGSIEQLLLLALTKQHENPSQRVTPEILDRVEGLTIYTASELDLEAPVSLEPGVDDFAIELHTVDGISLLVGGGLQVFPSSYVKRTVPVRVASGSVSYEPVQVQQLEPGVLEVQVSEGLRIRIEETPEGRAYSINLTLEPSLAGRLKAMEFYSSLLSSGAIEIGDHRTEFPVPREAGEATLRQHLRALRDLDLLFERLGVDTSLIDLTEVDDEQADHLYRVYQGLIKGVEFENRDARSSVLRVLVGGWALLVLVVPGSAEGRWRFVDMFSEQARPHFSMTLEGPEGSSSHPVTAYDVLKDDSLEQVLNLRLQSIVGAYQAIAGNPGTFELANQRVLQLVLAADASVLRREEFLAAAANLNDWLIGEQKGERHHLVNRWQISWRRGCLSTDDRRMIRGLRRELVEGSDEFSTETSLACCLILGDLEEARDLLQALSSDQLLRFKEWPIWNLWLLQSGDSLGDLERC